MGRVQTGRGGTHMLGRFLTAVYSVALLAAACVPAAPTAPATSLPAETKSGAPAAQVSSGKELRLMTGPQGGAWYPLGGAIADFAQREGISISVAPGGGIANVEGI